MRYHLILLLILLFGQSHTFGQSYTTRTTLSPKLQKQFEKVRAQVDAKAFTEAKTGLNKILQEDPNFIDGIIWLANIHYDEQDYPQAIKSYQAALQLGPEYQPRLFYQLALAQMRADDFAGSIPTWDQFLQREKKNPELIQRAQRNRADAVFAAEAIKKPLPFQPEKLPPSINSPEHAEFLPSLSADGQTMVFSRLIQGQEDFFVSKKKEGIWQSAEPLVELNTPFNEAGHCLSPDGKTLYYTACNQAKSLGGCDIYVSYYRDSSWTAPANLGAPINSGAWESLPSISAAGRAMIFASDRAGGIGGRDLWLSRQLPDGKWSTPRNLGAKVNTKGDEQAPFLHPDGATLYFMSNGHAGMGGFDLYLTRLDSAGNWSVPQNLGYPINTRANEGALAVSLDGSRAWFSTDVEDTRNAEGIKLGRSDIYSFILPEINRPKMVTFARGKVFDLQTQAPLAAEVEVLELASKKVFYKAKVAEDGTFLVCLPLGQNYALNASFPGHTFYSANFALAEIRSADQAYELSAGLQALPQPSDPVANKDKAPVVLRNVFFETASATLRPESGPELDHLADLLTQNPILRIQINGHTDNVGTEADNLRLSEQRAKAVYTYLTGKGIAAERLTYKGFGEGQPIADNNTEEGRKVNRRTEFVVL
ncbi:MAG TPA: OmpA family protein [Haliscomenobacter sp.]|uniref:OmpA family protein n=1 Tax=Haliscomenobacter sp. TaxID=2717303 RepID=UPI002BF66CE1|nr:OmpA family protein [Haliscomenobacter sp.]HOY16813.1 OmpA family protein [Haliscomenobacter sp.]